MTAGGSVSAVTSVSQMAFCFPSVSSDCFCFLQVRSLLGDAVTCFPSGVKADQFPSGSHQVRSLADQQDLADMDTERAALSDCHQPGANVLTGTLVTPGLPRSAHTRLQVRADSAEKCSNPLKAPSAVSQQLHVSLERDGNVLMVLRHQPQSRLCKHATAHK